MFSLDELGYLPFAQIRRLLFHFVSRLYDRTSGVTSRDFRFWHTRYLVAMRNLVAIQGRADIDQAAPINLDL
jgi:hypothetical protein